MAFSGRETHQPKLNRAAPLALALGLVLAACGGNQPPPPPPGGAGGAQAAPTVTSEPSGPVLAWDKTPGVIVVRLDRLVNKEPDYERLNRIPPCTLYGDGRLVWLNNLSRGEQILEAYLSDVAIRTFLEFIIRDKKFYDVPDYAAQELPPSETAAIESITLNLSERQRTIRSYRPWPGDMYFSILEACGKLSDTPAEFLPIGAWASAYEVTPDTNASQVGWPPTGQFIMAELSASGDKRWINGPTLLQLWRLQRETFGLVQWLENDKTYRVALQVPGVSRDAPPAPPGIELTPTPED